MIRRRHPALFTAAVLTLLASPAAAQSLDQAELTELEALLRNLGFDPGAVDGVVDADTTAAIQSYHDFALLPGPPEPTAQLLDELRGVAAAYSALDADKGQAAGAPPEPTPLTEPELAAPAPPPQDAPPSEKAIVPSPPPPPKLTAEAVPEVPVDSEEETPTGLGEPIEEAVETIAEETARVPAATVEPEATAALPPEAAHVPADEAPPPAAPSPPETVAALPPTTDEVPLQQAPSAEPPALAALAAPPSEADDALQASVEAALELFRPQLADGSLTRQDLARRFNKEGRDLMQQADYDAAILKFSVAIRLDPDFAGAYSNRGTVYRLQDDAERAEADLAKAKELGFGGFRLKDAKNPLQ